MTEPGTTLPELTRSLRALGAATSGIGGADASAAQLRYFEPLLASRRRAAEVSDPADVVRIFDGEALRARIEAALRAIARAHAGDDAPVRRATETLLLDAVEPLAGALRELDERARDAGEDPRSWDAWLSALLAVYRCADDCWFAVERALADAPIPEPAETRTRGKRAG